MGIRKMASWSKDHQPDVERGAFRGSCSSSSFKADAPSAPRMVNVLFMTMIELCRLKKEDYDYDDEDDEKPDELRHLQFRF